MAQVGTRLIRNFKEEKKNSVQLKLRVKVKYIKNQKILNSTIGISALISA